jgi:hypothetical protein
LCSIFPVIAKVIIEGGETQRIEDGGAQELGYVFFPGTVTKRIRFYTVFEFLDQLQKEKRVRSTDGISISKDQRVSPHAQTA